MLRLLIGSHEEEGARRLGLSAETVGWMVRNPWADATAKAIDRQRLLTAVGIDALSRKKRHPRYAMIRTDRTDPERPAVLAVAEGRDAAAARKGLDKLAPEPRRQVPSYRADRAQAFPHACQARLPQAKPVLDRFQGAKKFQEAGDSPRKQNYAGLQGEARAGGAEGVSGAEVAVAPQPQALTQEQKDNLEELFRQRPRRRPLYALRRRFPEIVDTARSRRQAGPDLLGLFLEAMDAFPELASCVVTYAPGSAALRNCCAARQRRAAVEGLNKQARVLRTRSYGLPAPDSLWTRLLRDGNRAKAGGLDTVDQIRERVAGFRAPFACT